MNQREPAEQGMNAIVSRLEAAGVTVPGDLSARLEAGIRPYTLVDVEVGAAPALVGAWCATRGADCGDEAVWIVLLSCFDARFSGFVPGLKEALQQRRMGIIPTRVEVKLQLASRCFHLGRRLVALDRESEAGRFLLRECVQSLTWVHDKQPRLNSERYRKFLSQLAAALTIFARRASAEEVVDLLVQAEQHSQAAEHHGDRSDERFAYRAEIGLRLHSATGDPSHLTRAHDAVASIPSDRTRWGRRLRTSIADLTAQRGYVALDQGAVAAGLSLLGEAEEEYTLALASAEDADIPDGYLLAKRGFARYRTYRWRLRPSGGKYSRLLEQTLGDWLDPRSRDYIDDGIVAGALLDRARIRARRNDTVGAGEDRVAARNLLPADPTPHLDAKLRTAELEHASERAFEENDFELLAETVETMILLPATIAVPAAALAKSCKALAGVMERDQWASLVERTIDRLETDLALRSAATAKVQQHIAGHAALLAWMLARNDGQIDWQRRSVELYRISFDASTGVPSADALANAGACALALGKALLPDGDAAAEEAAGLFVDGIGWLQAALDRSERQPQFARDDFDRRIVHSRLGEMALRAYSLRWNPDHLDIAITHLQTAREMGQDAIEMIGLLADAYYRRGTRDDDGDDFARAIELKDDVFEQGGTKRENRSLAAAAGLRLFRLTGESELLTGTATRALQAAQCDPAWPWAVLQLAELARHADLLDAATLDTAEPADLARRVAAGDREALLRRAATLAVANQEFTASILGGQQRSGEQGVRILNDPHRLLEQTLVLKRLERAEAHRERDTTVEFANWLHTQGAPATWRLPEPLAVVDLDGGDSVYVMRRATGRTLGSVAAQWNTGGNNEAPLPVFVDALRFLAAFQGWRTTSDTGFPKRCTLQELDQFRQQKDKVCRKLNLDADLRSLLDDACEPFVQVGSLVFAKKDPHPGNWLQTRRGDLVLLDLEATIALPFLQEAVTVIDDLPLLDVSPEGWQDRLKLCRTYIEALATFGLDVDEQATELEPRYEAMVALHALKGLSRLSTADPGISTFSLTARAAQEHHYRNLLRHLSVAALRPQVKALAAAASDL